MKNNLLLRPIHFRKDFNPLSEFLTFIFEDDLRTAEIDIRAELAAVKRFLPLLKIAGIFFQRFRYSMNGFVFENEEKKIVATINASASKDIWTISMVATHPEYRRMGLANTLVKRAIQIAEENGGKVCVLEVEASNIPAYTLYRKLGFIHFDTCSELKLLKENYLQQEVPFPEPYTITTLAGNNQNNMLRYELALRSTPQEVQDSFPINKDQYKESVLIKIFKPILQRVLSKKVHSFGVFCQDKLVATTTIDIETTSKTPHRMNLVIDPAHSDTILDPLISISIQEVIKSTLIYQNLLTQVRTVTPNALKCYEKHGFHEIQTLHRFRLDLQKLSN